MITIFIIPSALVYQLGTSVKNKMHGLYLIAMAIVFILGVLVCAHYEYKGNPQFNTGWRGQANMEGKEVRFGIFNSALLRQ